MTNNKIREVLTLYGSVMEAELPGRLRDKILSMIPKIHAFILEGRREKAFRWLGFIQGILWVGEWYTIEEMAEHNRSKEITDAV